MLVLLAARSLSSPPPAQEEELQSVSLREEVEKLQGEKCMLLETIENLKQIVDQTVTISQTETELGPEPKASYIYSVGL